MDLIGDFREERINIANFVKDKVILVPKIQRNFVGNDQSAFWIYDEIVNLKSKKPYIKEIEFYEDENGNCSVFDGQQRLSYICILGLLLNEWFEKFNIEPVPVVTLKVEDEDAEKQWRRKACTIKNVWSNNISAFLNALDENGNIIKKKEKKTKDTLKLIKESFLSIKASARFYDSEEDAANSFIYTNANAIPVTASEVVKSQLIICGNKNSIDVADALVGESNQILGRAVGYKVFYDAKEGSSRSSTLAFSLPKMSAMSFIKELGTDAKKLKSYVEYCSLCSSLDGTPAMKVFRNVNRNDFCSFIYSFIASKNKNFVTKDPKNPVIVSTDFFKEIMAPLMVLSVSAGANGLRGSIFSNLLFELIEQSISGKTPKDLNKFLLKKCKAGSNFGATPDAILDYVSKPSNSKAARVLLHLLTQTGGYNFVDDASVDVEHFLAKNYVGHEYDGLANQLGNFFLVPKKANRSCKDMSPDAKVAFYKSHDKDIVLTYNDLHDLSDERLSNIDNAFIKERSYEILRYIYKNYHITLPGDKHGDEDEKKYSFIIL